MMAQSSSSSLREIYINAEQVYERAELCVQQEDYAEAIPIFKSGLSILGDSYLTPDLLDDTGGRLILAQVEEKKGNLARAAKYLRSVLRNRLDVLKRRIH